MQTAMFIYPQRGNPVRTPDAIKNGQTIKKAEFLSMETFSLKNGKRKTAMAALSS
jgi:hypothetical protein